MEAVASYQQTGEAQIFLNELFEYRHGGKPRFFARNYWIAELKKIYENQTKKEATADKNRDTDFTKFVLSFYAVCRTKMCTKEHVNNEIIYKFLKKVNNLNK